MQPKRTASSESPRASSAAALAAMDLLPRSDPRWCIAASQAAIASGKLGDRQRLEAAGLQLVALADEGHTSGRMVVAAARASIPLLLAGLRGPSDLLLAHVNRHGDAIGWGDPGVAAWVHLARGTHAAECGAPEAAVVHMEGAASKFEEAGDVRGACAQCANIGWTRIDVGNTHGAADALRAGIERAAALGLSHVVSNARIWLGLVCAWRCAFSEAEALVGEAAGEFEARANQRMEAVARRALAEVLLRRAESGRGDSAPTLLSRAEREVRRAIEVAADTPPSRAHGLATLSDVLRLQGRAEEGLASAEEGRALLESQGHVVHGEARVRAAFVEALRATGREADADASLAAARAWLAARAEQIEPGERRDRFMRAVPDHARIVAMCGDLAPTDAAECEGRGPSV